MNPTSERPTDERMAEWVIQTYGYLLKPENAWDDHSKEFLDMLTVKLQNHVWDTLTMGLSAFDGSPQLVSMTRRDVEEFVAAGGPPFKPVEVR